MFLGDEKKYNIVAWINRIPALCHIYSEITLQGERFLLYDSRNDDEDEADDSRVIVFSTQKNIRVALEKFHLVP